MLKRPRSFTEKIHFLLTLNPHRPGRDVSPTQNGLADAETVKKRTALFLAWRPHLKALRLFLMELRT